MASIVHLQEAVDSWWVRRTPQLKVVFRVLFGVIWGIDGSLKFTPGLVSAFPQMVSDAAQGQPAWLSGWFSFWQAQVSADPALWVYSTGIFELVLALALCLGILRKLAYTGGILLSLVIWAVPEGFGGPYGPGSTDIGTGVIYAMVFLMLMVISATYGPSTWSVDYYLERRWPWWARLSEIRSPRPSPAANPDKA
jgi:nitrite reductase (NO-forming)